MLPSELHFDVRPSYLQVIIRMRAQVTTHTHIFADAEWNINFGLVDLCYEQFSSVSRVTGDDVSQSDASMPPSAA